RPEGDGGQLQVPGRHEPAVAPNQETAVAHLVEPAPQRLQDAVCLDGGQNRRKLKVVPEVTRVREALLGWVINDGRQLHGMILWRSGCPRPMPWWSRRRGLETGSGGSRKAVAALPRSPVDAGRGGLSLRATVRACC